jgi:hypothetical protein
MIRLFKIFLYVILPFCLFSCNEGMNTIFYNVTNDNLINDSDLSNTISVYGMVRFENPSPRYYIAAGNMYSRETADNSAWSIFSLTSGIHFTIATDNVTYIYVGIRHTDDTFDLYWYDPVTPASNVVTFPAGPPSMASILQVKNCGGVVLASAKKTDNTYSLYTITGTTATEVPFVASLNLTTFISDFTAQGGPTTIATGTHIYRGNTTDIAPDSGRTYNGVIYFNDGTNNLYYLSTNDGALYQSKTSTPSANLADWNYSLGYTKSNTSYALRFTGFAGALGSGPPPPRALFVGSRGNGFYEINPSGFIVSRFSDTATADLYNGAVESFFIDSQAPGTADIPRVFFCTQSAGLWRNDYTLGATPLWGGTWTRE